MSTKKARYDRGKQMYREFEIIFDSTDGIAAAYTKLCYIAANPSCNNVLINYPTRYRIIIVFWPRGMLA